MPLSILRVRPDSPESLDTPHYNYYSCVREGVGDNLLILLAGRLCTGADQWLHSVTTW